MCDSAFSDYIDISERSEATRGVPGSCEERVDSICQVPEIQF